MMSIPLGLICFASFVYFWALSIICTGVFTLIVFKVNGLRPDAPIILANLCWHVVFSSILAIYGVVAINFIKDSE